MRVWIAFLAVIVFCMTGCALLPRQYSDEQGPDLIEGLEVAPELRYGDIPVPRGFVYLRKESWTYEGKGGIRLADLLYKGKSPMQTTVDFFIEQMPISGWEKEMVVGPETKKRLRFKHTKKSDRCEVILERKMGTIYVRVRIN